MSTNEDQVDAGLSKASAPVKKAAAKKVATKKAATKATAKKAATKRAASKTSASQDGSVKTSVVNEITLDPGVAAAPAKAATVRKTAAKRAPRGAVAATSAIEATLANQPVQLDVLAELGRESKASSESGALSELSPVAQESVAVVKKTARKRATAAAQTIQGADEPKSEPSAAVAKTSPRKSASKKAPARKVAAGHSPFMVDSGDGAAVESGDVAVTARRSAKAAKKGSESTAVPTDEAGDAQGAASALAPPNPGELLFHAPDPEALKPKRRRAQAPAGPPPNAFGSADVPGTVEATVSPEPVEASPGREDDGDSEFDSDDGGRNRRRRGGRGRRGRSRNDEASEPESESTDESGDKSDATPTRTRSRGRDQNENTGSRTSRDQSAKTDKATKTTKAAKTEKDSPAKPGRAESTKSADVVAPESDDPDEAGGSSRRRRRRRRGSEGDEVQDFQPASARRSGSRGGDEVTALKGSTRLEAKRQRRREGRDAGRRRQVITEAEFLARRESVERKMIVRERGHQTQIAVLEDGVLVEHYVARKTQTTMVGNVYLGRVQNVLPSMEAAFVDIGKGRNAVLYAGEVNWDAAGLEGQPRRIEEALKSGGQVLVQVTKDPIGHKGARLTSQVTLAGRYLVYVPSGSMTGISRKLPETERTRLKKLLKEIVPGEAGVIVRTAAEGASDDELRQDVERLETQWREIEKAAKTASAPSMLSHEPDLAIRVVRDIFNEDFSSLIISGDEAYRTVFGYVESIASDLSERVHKYVGTGDVFADFRIDEQLAKGMDRKVWLPSGGSLVIDRTEAMTVVDVNTGKFTGTGGTLEETVTRNNIEAAEEIVRQLRLRDIGGIIVVDFIDMVLESNRELVLRRLVECLGRDRTKHQVAEVTSLGLVQMTRKRVGQGLVEVFSETCEHCNGRGFIVHPDPVEKSQGGQDGELVGDSGASKKRRGKKHQVASASSSTATPAAGIPIRAAADDPEREVVKATLATIAAAAAHSHEAAHQEPEATGQVLERVGGRELVHAPKEASDDGAPKGRGGRKAAANASGDGRHKKARKESKGKKKGHKDDGHSVQVSEESPVVVKQEGKPFSLTDIVLPAAHKITKGDS